MDELIAWTEIRIPQSVLRGETHEEWYSLSGKQGDGLEGSIDMVLSFNVSVPLRRRIMDGDLTNIIYLLSRLRRMLSFNRE